VNETPTPPPAPDHRSAKAEAKAAKAHAKAMRPWYKKKRFILPLLLLVVVVLAVSASGGDEEGTDVASSDSDDGAAAETSGESGEGAASPGVDAEGSEADDVAVESCAVGQFDYIEMKLKVTNNSSERSSYFIDAVVEGADGSQIESGFASVDNLEPGQSTVTDVALVTENPGTEFSCRVVEVERMSDQ